jgi:hypothetical protein
VRQNTGNFLTLHSTGFRSCVALVVVVQFFAQVTFGQKVRLIVSSKLGDRLSAKPMLRFEKRAGAETNTFCMDETTKLQTIDGFGASALEAGSRRKDSVLAIAGA